MKNVIFIYPKKASFIKLDIEILSSEYNVIENNYNWNKKFLIPIFLIKQLFFIISNIRKSKAVISSFGGYWSLIPAIACKLMNKPMYIILHGTDCCGFPEINYGNMNKPFLKWVLKLSYKYASKLLPVSNSLVYTENNYYSTNKTIKQGYKYFFPSNKTAYSVLHNGININFWRITNLKERDSKKFITVLSPGQFVRKGGELIINTALKLPDYQFIFIGINIPNDVKSIPKNVVFIPRTPPEKLLEMYNEAKYYLQLSIFEGFGVALCEAMACGCIPIVSSANVLPDIVGDSGYVLNNRNKELFIKLLKSIENEDNQSLSLKARQRIINNFTVESRKELLLKIIEQ